MAAQNGRSGAVTFAAILILVAGALNLIWGISALSDASYFEERELLFESLTTWGWFYIVLGAIQVAVSLLIFSENPLGFALGMFGSFLAILVNFVSVGAYPVWSVMLIALNFWILFVLATHLGE